MIIFGINIVETFHETSLQCVDIKGVIVADLVSPPSATEERGEYFSPSSCGEGLGAGARVLLPGLDT